MQCDADDGQLSASTRVVSDDVMPRRELRAQSPSGVDDLRLVARWRVVVPAERRGVGTSVWVTAKRDVSTGDHRSV